MILPFQSTEFELLGIPLSEVVQVSECMDFSGMSRREK